MVTEITRDELKQKLEHPKKFTLIDALPLEIYRQGHLPGALNMPSEQVDRLATEILPQKDNEVIVYCAGPSCHASEDVAFQLVDLGYSNVRRYVGGKQDWIDAGFPHCERWQAKSRVRARQPRKVRRRNRILCTRTLLIVILNLMSARERRINPRQVGLQHRPAPGA